MRKRDQALAHEIFNRVEATIFDHDATLVAKLRAAVEEAQRARPVAVLDTIQEGPPLRFANDYPRSVVTCVLTVAAMLENAADTMPVHNGSDAAQERWLRSRVENLRASVSGSDDVGTVTLADEVAALYDELAS